MTFNSWPQLLNHMVFLLKLALELFHVHIASLLSVGCLALTDYLLVNFVFANNFLHFGECGVSSERDLLSEIWNGLSVDFPLLVHLESHFRDLFLFRPDRSIFIVKHILQCLDGLVSSISHLLLLLITWLTSFSPMLWNSILQYFILWQILITNLPLFKSLNHCFFLL